MDMSRQLAQRASPALVGPGSVLLFQPPEPPGRINWGRSRRAQLNFVARRIRIRNDNQGLVKPCEEGFFVR